MEYANQIYINIFSVILIFTTLFSLYQSQLKKNSPLSPDEILYFLLAVSVGTILTIDVLLWVVEGYPKLISRRAYMGWYVVYFALHLIPSSIFIMYTDYVLFGSLVRILRILKIVIPANIIVILTSATNPWTEVLFSIDSSNHYARGQGFHIFVFLILAATLFAVLLMIIGRRKRSLRILFHPSPVPGDGNNCRITAIFLFWTCQ